MSLLTVGGQLRQACQTGVDALDADLLLLHALGRPSHQRAWLRSHTHDPVSDTEAARFAVLCQRRLDDEPVAYILGHRGFYGLDLHVDRRVLDPRPDTETLVDWALELLAGVPHPTVADWGTGSGAIALAIKNHRPDAQMLAMDASADALAVAHDNAAHLGLDVQFVQGSWATGSLLPALASTPCELIVSNPPYIAEGDPHLRALKHEPTMALTSGPDGLADIRLITQQAPLCLANHGWLLLEHGHDQALAVQTLFQQRGFISVQSRNDLAGIARCTAGQWCTPACSG